jgi:hypothetical protein
MGSCTSQPFSPTGLGTEARRTLHNCFCLRPPARSSSIFEPWIVLGCEDYDCMDPRFVLQLRSSFRSAQYVWRMGGNTGTRLSSAEISREFEVPPIDVPAQR